MFPVKAKAILPVEKIIIHSVSVRGELGNLTVWVSNDDNISTNANGNGDNNNLYTFRLHQRRWTKLYEKHHKPSRRKYDTLDLSANPIILHPGQVRAIYIHSTLPGDTAIVYDDTDYRLHGGYHRRNVRPTTGPGAGANRSSTVRYEDSCIAVFSGKAHLSNKAFGQTPVWGWGNAWRDRREFVGQINYGTVYKLWNPDRHISFGCKFRKATESMLVLQRRYETPVSMLPDECIYYIMNMCRWDWFEDNPVQMKKQYCRLKRKLREQQRLLQTEAEQHPSISATNNNAVLVDPTLSTGNNDTDDAMMTDADDDDEAEDDEDEAEDDEDDEEEWDEEVDHGYRASTSVFSCRDISSSEDEVDSASDDDSHQNDDGNEDDADDLTTQQTWFRSHFAPSTARVLRSLTRRTNA